MRWAELDNGALLAAANGSFDIFITTDRNLRYQQNLTGRKLAVVMLPTTSWPKIQRYLARVIAVVAAVRPGEYHEIVFADSPPADSQD